MTPVIIDLTEFVRAPIRSGIQRVARELIANWPASVPVRYASFEPSSLSLLDVSEELLSYVLELGDADNVSDAQMVQWIAESRAAVPRIPADIAGAKILVPEVFYPKQRIEYYRRMLERGNATPYFIVYDLIPWLKPQSVNVVDGAGGMMPYLELIKHAPNCTFISSPVREEYIHRVLRDPAREAAVGPAIPLGADGLKLERQTFGRHRRTFVCIGAFDGRKSQEVVFDAFLSLPEGDRGELVFIGRIPKDPVPALRRVLDHHGADVRILSNPTDSTIADVMSQALATFFVSTAEGFGLPAVESLAAGVPVVVHQDLPAVADLSDAGQLRLATIDVESIAGAMRTLLTDTGAKAIWSGAAKQHPQNWNQYVRRVADWMTGEA